MSKQEIAKTRVTFLIPLPQHMPLYLRDLELTVVLRVQSRITHKKHTISASQESEHLAHKVSEFCSFICV
jgi:hypothetical protein